jgi:hypothetical protein
MNLKPEFGLSPKRDVQSQVKKRWPWVSSAFRHRGHIGSGERN